MRKMVAWLAMAAAVGVTAAGAMGQVLVVTQAEGQRPAAGDPATRPAGGEIRVYGRVSTAPAVVRPGVVVVRPETITRGAVYELREQALARAEGENRPYQVKVEMVKATYLGVSTVPAEGALRKQLSLPEGVGLLVDYVDSAGPAKTAGVEKYDVLWKLDDQILINAEQLAVLVRTFSPGTEVKLTVIRKAKPEVLSVKLVEKEVPNYEASGWLRMGSPDGLMLPQPALPRRGGDVSARRAGAAGQMRVPLAPLAGGAVGGVGQAAVSYQDAVHALTITFKGDGKHLLAKDKNGTVLFDGLINTPEQRQAVPKDILKKVEELEKNTEIKVEVGGDRDRGS